MNISRLGDIVLRNVACPTSNIPRQQCFCNSYIFLCAVLFPVFLLVYSLKYDIKQETVRLLFLELNKTKTK